MVRRRQADAVCTCECPDGAGQHLCGCHSYDTDLMVQLREDYASQMTDFATRLKLLARGEIAPYRHENFAENLTQSVTRLCRIVADMAVEDSKNDSGRHDSEPWK